MTREVAEGVAAGALVTAYASALLLWVDGWYVAMAAALHTHARATILAVVAALFLMHALLVFVIASSHRKRATLWFVYIGAEFYPWAEVVEADTAEEAAGRVADFGQDPIAVFPFDALVFRHDGDHGTAWLEPGWS